MNCTCEPLIGRLIGVTSSMTLHLQHIRLVRRDVFVTAVCGDKEEMDWPAEGPANCYGHAILLLTWIPAGHVIRCSQEAETAPRPKLQISIYGRLICPHETDHPHNQRQRRSTCHQAALVSPVALTGIPHAISKWAVHHRIQHNWLYLEH